MLDLSLFRSKGLISAVWAMFAYASCAQVMTSILPSFFQNGAGFSAFEAGWAMLPFALAMLAFPIVGRRLDTYIPLAGKLTLGLAIVAAGNLMIALSAHLHLLPGVFAGMFVLGAGGGMLNGDTQKAVMHHVPHDRAGMASGISTTARFSGILIGFNFLSAVLAMRAHTALTANATAGKNAKQLTEEIVTGRSDLPNMSASSSFLLGKAQDIYWASFSVMITVAGVAAAISALIIWRLAAERNAP